MAVRYKTGNKATITFTSGSNAWTADIYQINPGEWTLGERDVSVLSDSGFLRRDPHDLAAPNDVALVLRFSPLNGIPAMDAVIDNATITFPKVGSGTAANLAGKGWFSRIAFPQLVNNETMSAEVTFAMSGESLAFTKETAGGGGS